MRQASRGGVIAWGGWLTAALVAGSPAGAATITVGHGLDDTTAGNGCSLREAVANANDDAATHADCAAGSGEDTIRFALASTITLGSTLSPTDNDRSTIDGDVDGDGDADIELNGNDNVRLLAVANGALVTLAQLTLRNGYADHGGAVLVDNASLSIRRSTLRNNFATFGGAVSVRNGGVLDVEDSTFHDNASGFGGGAINVDTSQVTLTNSTVSGNSAFTFGGGARVSAGLMSLVGSTLSGNTVTGNPGLNGRSLYLQMGGSVTLARSLIASRFLASTSNCFVGTGGGSVADGGGNVQDGDASCGAGIPNANTNLGPLQNNGGPTPTHRPGAGSAAVDAADCDVPAGTDQRGIARPQGARCDSGAVELRTAMLSVTVSGAGSLSADVSPMPASSVINACTSDGGNNCTARYDIESASPQVTMRATPAVGQALGSFTAAPCGLTTNGDGSRTTSALSADCAVTVSFVANSQFEVTASTPGNGSITPASQQVTPGGTANFVVTPAANHHVASVIGTTCTPVDQGNGNWSASNITQSCAVTATFAADGTQGLAVSVNDNRSLAEPGDLLTYRIVVRNFGPGEANGIQLGDTLPAALQNPMWTCTTSVGGSCAPTAGTGALGVSVSLPQGGEATLDFDATVGPFDPTLDYSVNLTPPNGYNDPDPADNSATDRNLRRIVFRHGFEQ